MLGPCRQAAPAGFCTPAGHPCTHLELNEHTGTRGPDIHGDLVSLNRNHRLVLGNTLSWRLQQRRDAAVRDGLPQRRDDDVEFLPSWHPLMERPGCRGLLADQRQTLSCAIHRVLLAAPSQQSPARKGQGPRPCAESHAAGLPKQQATLVSRDAKKIKLHDTASDYDIDLSLGAMGSCGAPLRAPSGEYSEEPLLEWMMWDDGMHPLLGSPVPGNPATPAWPMPPAAKICMRRAMRTADGRARVRHSLPPARG